MKKEAILAIILGISLGFVVTFGIWKARSALKTLPAAQATPTPSQTNPSPTGSPELKLVIDEPADNDLVSEDSVLLSGETVSGGQVIIMYEGGEVDITADSDGKFSTEIPLEAGFNEISIFASDPEGNEASTQLTVTYTTAEI